ncbi:CDGSH iron-sulfur domain-containing protein [Gordonia sp. DT30]|uniref:CDGSH iron-sulfur domain-containing protein n=1 Tax=Gordonia sp. DT30 TaxID=3416546 RepID=UPI003CF2F508
MSGPEERTQIRVIRGGPIMVPGPVDIELPDGSHVQSDRFMVAVCACGRSRNYPLCDTSHRRRRRE